MAELRRQRPDLALSISATTRAPRPGETPGAAYHFLDDAEFDRLVASGGFLEWAEFGGRRYGTPWTSVAESLAAGRTVLLEIEVQGALQIRERFPDAVLVFLRPPDEEALLERLRRRGADSPERIAERLDIGRWELSQASAFDHIVVNDDVEAAAARIASILGEVPVE